MEKTGQVVSTVAGSTPLMLPGFDINFLTVGIAISGFIVAGLVYLISLASSTLIRAMGELIAATVDISIHTSVALDEVRKFDLVAGPSATHDRSSQCQNKKEPPKVQEELQRSPPEATSKVNLAYEKLAAWQSELEDYIESGNLERAGHMNVKIKALKVRLRNLGLRNNND